MTDRAEFSLAFKRIQPLCASLSHKCCLEDLLQIEQTLNDLDSEFISKCHEYLLFPIRISLLKNVNENQLIKLLDIATFIFKKTRIESCPLFESVVSTIFTRISDLNNIDMVSSASEEVKLSVCQCASSVVESSSEEVLCYMYGSSFNLQLAHVFHTLLLLLKHERSKSLRRAILRTIGLFCYSKEFIVSRNTETEMCASNSLANYLPGLSVGLSSVVCGDDIQGESVIRMALRILSEVIVITVNDCCPVATNQKDESNNKSDKNNVNNSAVNSAKDSKWFEEVASRLYLLIQNTTVLVTHGQWKVRQDYLSFARSILLDCTRNLQTSVPVLLSTVFALSVDSNKNISQQSQKLILMFSDKFQAMNCLTLCSLIEDEMYLSASKLIKSKLSASDDEKLFILKSMQGCLQILGSSVDNILFSNSHLEKLMLSLLNLLEFETSVVMVEEISVNLDVISFDVMPKKRFCYFEKKEILDSICNICQCLGKSKYNRLVIDFLLEKMHTTDIFLMQSIFVIGCVVEGLTQDSSAVDENMNLVSDIIVELLGPEVFGVPDLRWVATNDKSCGDMYSDNSIYQICLVLETVEKCAKLLRKNFRPYLSKVLFNIMEKAGSSNYIISQSGKLCLYGIAHYCDYNPRVELVRDNVDYLVHCIAVNEHILVHKPEICAVLQVVLQESDREMLPMFQDCIQRLLSVLDYNQEQALPIMAILRSVVLYVRKWFPSKKIFGSEPTRSSLLEKSKNLKIYFTERNKKRKELLTADTNLAESASETSNQTTDDKNLNGEGASETNDENEDFVEEKVPLHATLLSKILNQCSNFQSSRNLQLRVLVLEVMELSILALGDFERELHPLIHQLWNFFVHRFSEENIVMLQAFKVLLVIADECRDFVRTRCIKDVVPKLLALLKNKFSSSLLKNYIKSYQWSNDCKLQLCVLSEIGDLFLKLQVTEKNIAELTEVCLPYLQNSQPKVLREAALKTLQALAVVDPDAIWFYFNDQYSEEQFLNPPHKSLRPVHFALSTPIDPQFKIDC